MGIEGPANDGNPVGKEARPDQQHRRGSPLHDHDLPPHLHHLRPQRGQQ
jgi:hypothetical protein